MIPTTNDHEVLRALTFETDPSFTYKMLIDRNRIISTTDGQNAMVQAIYKILMTERFMYPIYSWNYGIELQDLFGRNMAYIEAELERRIKEALLTDDRITAVDGFSFSHQKKNSIYVEFTAHTTFGDVLSGKEFTNGNV